MVRKILTLTMLLMGTPLYSEVVSTVDGKIYFGRILSAEAGYLKIESFGKEILLPATDVVKTEKSLESLTGKAVEILLKDNSIIRGKITDYDSEIGIFIDISFGTLTIPEKSINYIYDSDVKRNYEGSSLSVMGGFSLAQPVTSSDYGLGTSFLVESEWKTPWLRGFFLGGSLDYSLLSYQQNALIKYAIARFSVIGTYKLFNFHSNGSSLYHLVPYAQLSVGPAFILVDDNRPNIYPNRYSGVVGHGKIQIGNEFGPFENFYGRLFGSLNMDLQSTGPFVSFGGGLAIGYSF